MGGDFGTYAWEAEEFCDTRDQGHSKINKEPVIFKADSRHLNLKVYILIIVIKQGTRITKNPGSLIQDT